MNHYDLLGVTASADPAELRRAYVRMARRYHPDLHATADPTAVAYAENQMRELNLAWEVLRDEQRRAAYDRSIGAAAAASAMNAGAASVRR